MAIIGNIPYFQTNPYWCILCFLCQFCWKFCLGPSECLLISRLPLHPQRRKRDLSRSRTFLVPRPPMSFQRRRLKRRCEEGDQRWWPLRTAVMQCSCWDYPLVMANIAMENGHRNSEFSHKIWWFSIAMLNYQRVWRIGWWIFQCSPDRQYHWDFFSRSRGVFLEPAYHRQGAREFLTQETSISNQGCGLQTWCVWV